MQSLTALLMTVIVSTLQALMLKNRWAVTYEEYEKKKIYYWKRARQKADKMVCNGSRLHFMFYAVEKRIGYLEEYVIETTVNFRLNAILVAFWILFVLVYLVSGFLMGSLDVLQSFRNIATGIRI